MNCLVVYLVRSKRQRGRRRKRKCDDMENFLNFFKWICFLNWIFSKDICFLFLLNCGVCVLSIIYYMVYVWLGVKDKEASLFFFCWNSTILNCYPLKKVYISPFHYLCVFTIFMRNFDILNQKFRQIMYNILFIIFQNIYYILDENIISFIQFMKMFLNMYNIFINFRYKICESIPSILRSYIYLFFWKKKKDLIFIHECIPKFKLRKYYTQVFLNSNLVRYHIYIYIYIYILECFRKFLFKRN